MAGAEAPLALTMGDPAGVGPDLILQLFSDRQALGLPVFAVYGDAGFLAARAERLGIAIAIETVEPGEAGAAFSKALPVVGIEGGIEDRPGEEDPSAAPLVIGAIARAVDDTLEGITRGIVTAPINKAALHAADFDYPGHTEFLAALCADEEGVEPTPVMMLACAELRAVPLTIHIPLAHVPGRITRRRIERTVGIVAADLRTRFGIDEPRLAVAGLNPHAGEDGMMGREEIEVIGPAVRALQAAGIDVVGPLSADTLFHPPHWRQYDAVIAMYHDQALIPVKTVGFDTGVNVTLGLPIVRTSPDHGTAYGLAGTGRASTGSMLAAIRMADTMA